MKTVKLKVTETLKYHREIIVKVPDEMDEKKLNKCLDRAQRNQEYVSEFVHELEKEGIKILEPYDDDLSSPDYAEVECDDYDFISNESVKQSEAV